MNDSSTGPLVIGLLFIVRCLIPLGILFGISYLLQRLGLVDNQVDENKTGSAGETKKGAPVASETTGITEPSSQKKGKKRTAAPKTRSRIP